MNEQTKIEILKDMISSKIETLIVLTNDLEEKINPTEFEKEKLRIINSEIFFLMAIDKFLNL